MCYNIDTIENYNEDEKMHDMLNVSTRVMVWQRAQSAILQQHQHGWVLNGIDMTGAEQSIGDALQFAADLRHLADVIEAGVDRATGMLE